MPARRSSGEGVRDVAELAVDGSGVAVGCGGGGRVVSIPNNQMMNGIRNSVRAEAEGAGVHRSSLPLLGPL